MVYVALTKIDIRGLLSPTARALLLNGIRPQRPPSDHVRLSTRPLVSGHLFTY